MADLPVTGGSGLFAPADGKDKRAGARDGMEQYVGVGQAKAWLQQNEEALPSQRASLKPLDSSRLQRSSRSPKRPGHSLVVPVAVTPDLPETEGVVKPHRSTAVRLLEGLEGIETSDSLIDLPAEARVRGEATTAPTLQPRDGPGRLGLGCGSRSVPELEKMEPVRVLQTSPVLSRRTLHPTMWGSPRETRVAPPRLYWPTMTGRSNDNTVDITSKQPVRLLSPAVSRRNIEPVSVADKSGSPAAPLSLHTASVASVPVSPPFSCRRAAESWNPPPRLIEQDFSWQPENVETVASSLEKVTRAVPEAGSPVVPGSAMSLTAPVFQSRATLGSTSDWKKISFNPVVNRSILTPPGAQVSVSPPVRSFFPSYPMARSPTEARVFKTPPVVVRYVRPPILLHAVPAQPRALRKPDTARIVHGVK